MLSNRLRTVPDGPSVARMMQNDNLLTIRRRELSWATDQGDEVETYLSLASRLKVGGRNHVRIADITYIRLKGELFICRW